MASQHKLSRRLFLRASAALGAGLLTLACAPVPTAPAGDAASQDVAAEAVELTIWHVDEHELDPIIAAFEEQNPGINVKFEFFPWDNFWTKLDTAYAAGEPPDVHRQDDDEIPFFAQREVLLPLEEHLQAMLNKDELFWDAVASTMIGGHLWVAVPAMRVGNLVYNKTMFQEAGIELPPTTFPADAWNWETFRAVAKQLSQPAEQRYGFAGADNADFITSMGRSQGGQILSEDCGEFLMHEDVMAGAMQACLDMILVDKSAVDPETVEAFGGGFEMFNAGQIGMIFAETRDVPAEDVAFEWDVAGLPSFPGHDPVIFAAIECYGIPKVTKHPDQATAFAAFLMSEEAQNILAETKNLIPINQKAATEVWAAPDKVPASRKLLVEALQYGRTLPFAVGFGRVQDIAWPLIQEAALGQKTAKAAMEEAKPLADEELAKAGDCLGSNA